MSAAMDINSDDVMYRVDSVWLGPPKATFPWRARYVSWGVGLTATLLTLGVLRLWLSFGFFLLGWSLVIGVGITRLVGTKLTHERPLRDVARMAVRELTTPREHTATVGGTPDLTALRMREHRPAPHRARSREADNG
jgi:hypothetical protein